MELAGCGWGRDYWTKGVAVAVEEGGLGNLGLVVGRGGRGSY